MSKERAIPRKLDPSSFRQLVQDVQSSNESIASHAFDELLQLHAAGLITIEHREGKRFFKLHQPWWELFDSTVSLAMAVFSLFLLVTIVETLTWWLMNWIGVLQFSLPLAVSITAGLLSVRACHANWKELNRHGFQLLQYVTYAFVCAVLVVTAFITPWLF